MKLMAVLCIWIIADGGGSVCIINFNALYLHLATKDVHTFLNIDWSHLKINDNAFAL